MGRKKDQFIDKNKAITFKLSYRDNEDPFFQRPQTGETNIERVFEVKSLPMDHTLTEEERNKRDKLLSLFTSEDQGIFDQKPKEPTVGNKFWVPPEIRKKLAGKDLWIDQLATKTQLQEQDVEDYEIEELEDVEEVEEREHDGQDEEEYTEEEEEVEEEEEIPTKKTEVKSNKQKVSDKPAEVKKQDKKEDIGTQSDDDSYDDEEEDDEGNRREDEEQDDDKPQTKMEDLTSADFPDFKYKSLVEKKIVEDNIIPKYDKITFSKDVKFKKFNEYGLPASNFDYSKYFVQPSQQNSGVVEAILFADYKTAPKLKEDIDYEYYEMTEEQKEVFEALDFDEADGYEELEDDFVNIANEGKKAIVKDLVEEEIEETVTGKKKVKTIGRKMNFVFDHEGKLLLDEENPLPKKKVVKKVIKNYKLEDSKPSEQAKSKQDKKFDKVMKEMEDSYDEDNYIGSSGEDYDIPELQEGILTGEGFNKILDAHIAGMSEHNKEVMQLEMKGKKKNLEFDERQQHRYEQYKDYGKFEEIVKRQLYEPVPLDQDNALKSYLERERRREEDPDFNDENFDKPLGENKLDETIATKNFSFSKVHESLNVIGDDINLSRSKKYKKLRNADEDEEHAKEKKKEEPIEQISEDEEEQEEEEEEKDPLKIRSYELSKKIDREETKEEKAARKQALKEFKDARKQKKKLYKEGFETLTKEHQSKFINRTNHHNIQNVKGISIKNMM